jgi:hypothetical protein
MRIRESVTVDRVKREGGEGGGQSRRTYKLVENRERKCAHPSAIPIFPIEAANIMFSNCPDISSNDFQYLGI